MNKQLQNLKKILPGLLLLVLVILMIFLGYRILTDASKSKENPYEYDIGALKEIDPALIQYTEVKTIKTGQQKLNALALDQKERLYVAGDTSLMIFNQKGEISSKVKLKAPVFCLAISAENEIFLGLRDNIEIFDSTGSFKSAWKGAGENAYFTSIAIENENVYVADAGNRIVYRFNKAGELLNRIGEKDESQQIPGFIVPSPYFDLAIGTDGTLWVVNPGRHSLENYTADGNLRSWWQKTSMQVDGFCGCCNPSHIAIMADGSFVTSEKGIVRVKIHKPTGEFASVVAPPSHFSPDTEGMDLAVGSDGKIYVLDPKAGLVRIFIK
jgi:sugar lactone lactonase YvrE